MQIKSLAGLVVFNTRPGQGAAHLNQAIESLGGKAVHLPLFKIQPLKNSFDKVLTSFDIAIFTSSHAVHCFFLDHQLDSHCKVVAIGKATFKTLQSYGIHQALIPNKACSESLLEMTLFQQPKDKHILLIKGQGGRPLIEESLVKKGAQLTPLIVYKRVSLKLKSEILCQLWQDETHKIILFTSEEAILSLWEQLNITQKQQLNTFTCLVISERLRAAAASKGMKHIIVCTYENIIQALCENCIVLNHH